MRSIESCGAFIVVYRMFTVTVLGTSSAVPAYGRYPTSQIVNHNSRLFLLDAGEGTQFQLQRYHIRLRNLDAIFISHLHGDHVYGLPGLLTSLSIYGRTEPLVLIGVPGVKAYLEHQFGLSETRLLFPLEIKEIAQPPAGERISAYENKWITVYAVRLQHRVPTVGYVFQEKPKTGHLLADKALADGLSREYFHLLKAGNDVSLPSGKTFRAADYTGEPDKRYSYAYCTDTAYYPELIPAIRGCTVLYHEATFLHDLQTRATETRHSTATQAAQMASQAGVSHLVLGHYSARYPSPAPLLAEALMHFANTSLAVEGHVYAIPFNDVTPVLHS